MPYSRTDLTRATRCVEELEQRALRLRTVTGVRHERGLDTAGAEALAGLLDSALHQARADRDTVARALSLQRTIARRR